MATTQLTHGAVREMTTHLGQRPGDHNPAKPDFRPVVQIINLKAVGSNPEHNDRFRAVLSDGTHYVQGMLATQLNKLVHDQQLQQDSIVQIKDYMNNRVADKTVVIVLKLEILHTHATRIGNPVDVATAPPPPSSRTVAPSVGAASAAPLYARVPEQPPLYNSTNYATSSSSTTNHPTTTTHAASAPTTNAPTNNAAYGSSSTTTNSYNKGGSPGRIYNNNTKNNNNPYGSPQRPSSSHSHGSSSYQQHQQPIVRDPHAHQAITSIANLNMYNNRWTIRARVTSKSDIRTWSNAKGEGTLFSIELLDSHNMDIRATFFKEAVDKFYHFLQVGKVYRLSGGKLKVANLQYNTCQSQYEITFDQNSEIHLEPDELSQDIQTQHYQFVPIAQLESVAEKQFVDVLGIVKSVQEPVSLISKKSGQELIKCDCTLLDQTQVEINVTLWGEKARKLPMELSGQPVVAFRRARVSDYNGKSLTGGDAMEINPWHIPQAQELLAWWKSEGSTATSSTRSLSLNSGGAGKMDSLTERKSVSSIKEEGLGQGTSGMDNNKTDWLSVKATVTFLKKDKEGGAWYTACPNANEPCKNRFKVTQTTDAGYYCEKCQQHYDHCVRRWIFSGVIEDDTGSTWVSFFNEQAEQLLGVTADEVYKNTYDNGGHDQDAYESYFAKANYTEWIFKCKVKNELVNDEQRVKTSVYSMFPIDPIKESNDMMTEIDKF